MAKSASEKAEKVILTSCSYDCGSRCLLKVYVKDGRIERIRTDDRPMPSLKACIRGLMQAEVVYAPDRLTKPLKRVGTRGEGKFETISWDEALETVSKELLRVKGTYGRDAIFLMEYSGSLSPLHGMGKAARRFFSVFGGCTTSWGSTSYEAGRFSSVGTFGTIFTGTTRDNFLHSKLIILWGWNPLVTRFGPTTAYYLAEAKKAGTRIVSVDPRLSPTAKTLAGQWISIKPCTDTAMLIAMAHVMMKEDLCDRSFIEAHTVGFEKFEAYVLGREDGVPKTPRWAEAITGVEAGTIEQLALDYATLKPAALVTGWAPGRTAYGEQYHRAASVLAAMTGNIGVTGGYAAGSTGRIPLGFLKETLPVPENPGTTVHVSDIYKALLEKTAGGSPKVRLLYIVGCNLLTQFLNANKGVKALQAPEFVVVHERFLTPTARYADIILPVSSALEGMDIGQPWGGAPYTIFMKKAIEPIGETKSDLEIFTELASRLHLGEFNRRTDEEWLKAFVDETPGLPEYEAFKEKGFHEIEEDLPWVAFREQVESGLPFPTPSGKIEIYSQTIAEMNDPKLPPIPTYIEPWEGPGDPLRRRYPLQMISPHAKTRSNSQFDNIPSLKALADDTVWVNTEDARTRGIENGDRVRVYNDRGRMVRTVTVTDRIIPGVVSLDAGAWYDPDDQGIDRGGCVNVLTRDDRSPGGAFPCNSCLVEIQKEE